jgi:hypothetical protein
MMTKDQIKAKAKVKMSLYLIEHHEVKVYGEADV